MKESIAERLENDTRFATFMSLIKYCGLYNTLNSAMPLTVFCPINTAFEKLGATNFAKLINEKQGKLTRMVQYHIVYGVYTTGALVHGSKLQTLNGNDISIYNANEILQINEATVLDADVILKNGVIHTLADLL